MHKFFAPRCVALLACACASVAESQAQTPVAGPAIDARDQVATYGEIAFRSYTEAYQAAVRFQAAVVEFVASPPDDIDEALATLRQAWLDTRPSYGQTEALRFYEGPIDFGKRTDGSVGPEPLLNSWPVNEAYIDYVRGNPKAGIVNDPSVPITRESLIERNARDDEADVTTGYHTLEFLLWGQDLNANGPGNRPGTDFVGAGAPARRRAYLKAAADLLVENLETLVQAWAPGQHNYREQFAALDARESVSKMLTGLATLAAFEVGYERLATALDSGSQEDEHSCFSDSTHIDILANVTGIENLYFGRRGDYHGTGIDALIRARNPELADRIDEQMKRSLELAAALDVPFDKTLTTTPGSPQRAKVEALVTALQTEGRLLKLAGAVLSVNIVVTIEVE